MGSDSILDNWRGQILLFLLCVVLGVASTLLWQNRYALIDLYVNAAEQKYKTMAGEVGPVTYLVTHHDFSLLEEFAQSNDDVLGIEVFSLPDKASVAFVNGATPAVAKLAALDVVDKMEWVEVPMLCH